MTEGCQTKFTERINNQNYIVYGAIIIASLAVLYFYRFHFVTIAISYVLGCVFCHFGLNSSILNNYLEVLESHYQSNERQKDSKDVFTKICVTCGSKECVRHDAGATSEPWAGLYVHKQLDQAIEEFYNTILDQFINSWYNKITLQPFFVDELRHQLRYASACLLQRAVKINYSRFITERLLPCALRHYTLCADSTHARPAAGKMAVHPAAANRTAELKYLRCVTNAVMPYLLRGRDLHNSVFRILLREIFAGWVLLSLTDLLADPYILNTLIVLATDEEHMSPLPTSPDYTVEFLETFARQSDSVYSARCKLLKVELEWVLGEQQYLYAFMQFLKHTSDIHLLQFYKDIKSFQTKILNPELSPQETASFLTEAWDIYNTYFDPDSASCVPLDPSLGAEMKGLLNGPDSIKRLQTSRALYQAARQSHAALAKSMLPRFLHSEEFYKVVVGSRIPIGYQKEMTKKQQEGLVNTASKLGSKLKGALKTQVLDGQILDNVSNSSADTDCDSMDNIDVVKYLGNLASEESLRGQDLSTFKVVLTNIETQLQPPPRRGPVRVLTLAVHRAAPAPAFWSVRRSEHDFHLLRSKMHEFHGDLLQDLPLPSRRDNSPLETLRYKYEDFIQRLLQKSLLQTSELLHLFLTVDTDFALVVQASSLSANSTDLTNIYQSMAHKLRKEKGQHLEGFLSNYLITADMERFQLLKPQIEEALEVDEDIELFRPLNDQSRKPRDISSSTFENNFDTEPVVFIQRENLHQEAVKGFTQCFMYLLLKIVKPGALVIGVIGAILSISRHLADLLFDTLLRRALYWLSHRRLAALVRLTHSLLFTPRSTGRRPAAQLRERALARLLGARAAALPATARALRTAHELLQRPAVNKQLVYNLLDLCLMELFPELGSMDGASKEPKS